MTFTTMNDTAGNGRRVNTTVELLIPEKTEEFVKLPWRVEVHVDGAGMHHSHHATRHAAEQKAERMHKSYLGVHRGEATCPDN